MKAPDQKSATISAPSFGCRR